MAKPRRDRLGRFCDIYCTVIHNFDTLLRYVISVTFCGAAVLKVMDQTLRHSSSADEVTGADPGFFLGGGALVSGSTSTPINHIFFFFCRIPFVLENRRSSHGGVGGGAHPLHPTPRSAPEL